MPLYEYQCRKCGHRFEKIQQFSDKPVRRCPKCKTGRVEKLVSAPAFHFKGTGWYVTDYASKGKRESREKDSKADKAEKTSGTEKPAAGKEPATKESSPKDGSGRKPAKD